MYSSTFHKRKLYPSTQYLTRPKFNTNMRFKSSVRNYGLHSPTSPDGKMKKNKSRKYATIPSSLKLDTRRKLDNFTDAAYNEAVSRLRVLLNESYSPKITTHIFDDSGDDTDDKSVFSNFTRISKHYHTPVPYKRELMIPKQTTNQLTKDPPSNELMSFIERQEDYINQLEKESQYCRHELAGLLDKVKEVISENEQLHKKQKLGIMKTVTDTLDTTETDDDPTDITSTKKYTTTTTKRPLEGPAIVFESRISELEAQLTQCKIDLKKKQDENDMLQRQLSENVICDSPAIKKQLEMLQREKENLQDTISKLQISAALDNDHMDKKQIEQARWERERTETKLRRLQSELQRVTDNSAEQARRFASERDALERRYTQQIDQLNTELTVQWDTASKLQLELDKQRREITDLRRELSQKNAYIDDLKKELQSKTVTLQSEQSQSTAEKCSLEQELANAKLNADCTERAHKQECARLQSEITSLRQRLDRADADALHMRRENMRLSEKLSSLEKELNLNKLLTDNRNTSSYGDQPQKEPLPIMALPPPRESSDSTREKDLTSMVKNIEAKHEATVAELEEMIQSQNALMEKLTGECHTLTKKLEESSVKHKNEIAKLQNSLKTLSSKLDDTQKNTANNYRMKEKHNTPINSDKYSKPVKHEDNNVDDEYPEQNGYDNNSDYTKNQYPDQNKYDNSNNYVQDNKKSNDISQNENYNDTNYLNVDDQNAISSADEKQDYETTYEETYPNTEDTEYHPSNADNTNYIEQYDNGNAPNINQNIPDSISNTGYENTSDPTKYVDDSNVYNENITNPDQMYNNQSDISQEQQQYADPNDGYQYSDNQNYIPEQQYTENMDYQMDPNYSNQQYDETGQNQNYTEQEYVEQPQEFIEEESRPPETNNG